MAETTNIAWCRSTLNLWIGCTKVGPGCDGCYAAAADMRFTGGKHWGAGAPRRRTKEATWNQAYRWNRRAPNEEFAGRKDFWPVFVNSQSDFFDNEVPQAWRDEAWRLMRECRNLTFLLVTKRVGNIKNMLPPDWGNGYPNVWLLITVVDQSEAERDIPKLLSIPAVVHGVSYEPALGPVDWKHLHVGNGVTLDALTGCHSGPASAAPLPPKYNARIDWIIPGGESDQRGHEARPFDVQWARDTIEQCRKAFASCFVKQLGARPIDSKRLDDMPEQPEGADAEDVAAFAAGFVQLRLRDRNGADPSEWPEDLRVQEFPNAT